MQFDKDTKITERFLQWGAKRADRWDHGVTPERYSTSLKVEDIYSRERDVDLVYVGTSGIKVACISKLKRAFPQMQIYGRGWRGLDIIAGIVRSKKVSALWDSWAGGLWHTAELPIEKLVPLYQRSKIGINVHLSYSLANERLYQLPANGVMQLSDCPDELNEVFDLGKEVVGYHSIKEAINLARYYLAHDNERKDIAAAGFLRVMKDYQRVHTFTQTIDIIKRGMLEDGKMLDPTTGL